MITEINGDIIKRALNGEFDIIVHGANCFNTMGAGVALQIKNTFPSAYHADCETEAGDFNKLGNYTEAKVKLKNGNDLIIINAYTQYDHKVDEKPFDYDAFTLICKKIRFNYGDKKIAMPLIGAGLAGGSWDVISEIIQDELGDTDLTVVHYKKE